MYVKGMHRNMLTHIAELINDARILLKAQQNIKLKGT